MAINLNGNAESTFLSDVDIGGGNIELNADGTAEFTNQISVQSASGNNSILAFANDASNQTFFSIDQAAGQTAASPVFMTNQNGSRLTQIRNDGTLQIGGTLLSVDAGNAPNISLRSDGTGMFAGNIIAAGLYLRDASGGIDVKRRLLHTSNGGDSFPVFIGNKQIQVFTPSDRRTKENIKSTTVNAADIIKGLEVVDFNFIGSGLYETDDTSQKVGFIAQDVDRLFPQAVQQPHEDGGLLAVKKEELIPVLTKALQTALTRIEALEAANASLEARLTALEGGNS